MFESLHAIYRSEVAAEAGRLKRLIPAPITEFDLAPLPAPAQRYFRHCGWLGLPKWTCSFLKMKGARIKLNQDKDWTLIDCDQFNAAPEPVRIVYMHSNLMGIIPFEGRDKYQNGHGNMRIRLLRYVTVADETGPAMDASALVTLLAETFLLPTYALQPYIRWTPVDELTATATLSHQGSNVTGTFHFNKQGEMLRMETGDRYLTLPDGTYQRTPWEATILDYAEENGIRYPVEVAGTWHLDSGPFEYFHGRISELHYGNPVNQPGFLAVSNHMA